MIKAEKKSSMYISLEPFPSRLDTVNLALTDGYFLLTLLKYLFIHSQEQGVEKYGNDKYSFYRIKYLSTTFFILN